MPGLSGPAFCATHWGGAVRARPSSDGPKPASRSSAWRARIRRWLTRARARCCGSRIALQRSTRPTAPAARWATRPTASSKNAVTDRRGAGAGAGATAIERTWRAGLLDTIEDDDPPYGESMDESMGESLGEHEGALCAAPYFASQWAEQRLPRVRHVMANRNSGA
jgi:hypothetical protein